MLNFTVIPTIKYSVFGKYKYVYACQLCGEPTYLSVPYQQTTEETHAAAQQRAREHFAFCPDCGRWVCDNCFTISDEGDFCLECAQKRKLKGVIVGKNYLCSSSRKCIKRAPRST